MTVSEYIRQSFMEFGVRLSDAVVEGILLREDLTGTSELDSSNIKYGDIAVVRAIPMLLLSPQSISEGGYSLSRAQRDSIEAYYSLMCKKYGIKDELTKRPKVKFL